MRFRFIGDPRNGGDGPDVVTLGDYEIGRVDFVAVTDEALALKLAGNGHFECDEGEGGGTPSAVAGWPVDVKRKR